MEPLNDIEILESRVADLEETVMELRQQLGDKENQINNLELDRDNLMDILSETRTNFSFWEKTQRVS